MADLILYSNGCPKCRVIKSKLEAKKITFTENNNVEELIPMGIRSLPILNTMIIVWSFAQQTPG